MSEISCAWVGEHLPEWAAGALPSAETAALDVHLEGCASCRADAEVVRLIRAGRPAVPDVLADRIRDGIPRRRVASSHPWWGLGAAAVAVLAVGIGVMSSGGGVSNVTVPAYAAADTTEGTMWLSDDGLIAGAPALDGLSDQALEELLQEMGA